MKIASGKSGMPSILQDADNLLDSVQKMHEVATEIRKRLRAGQPLDPDFVATTLEPASLSVHRASARLARTIVARGADRRKMGRGLLGLAPADDFCLEYVPQPLGPQPLCVPLPASWHDDPEWVLGPYAYAGCTSMPAQFGAIGTTLRAGELLAQDYGGCFAHAYFGSPESGKTYIEGVHIESALIANRYQNRLPRKLCALSFGYGRHGGGSHMAEQIAARLPNQHPGEVRRLIHEYGTLPEGVEDVLVLTVSSQVEALRRECPHCQVLGIRFCCRELGITGLKRLMILSDKTDSLLAEEISDMIDSLPQDFKKEDLIEAARKYRFRNRYLRRMVLKRVRLACKLIDDRSSLRGLLRPGRLIVVEVRDAWLPWQRAMKIFQNLLDILVLGEGPLPCNLLLCIDEAHKFLVHPDVRLLVEHVIRERRHLGVSVVLSSQDPQSVPHSTLSELDGVGLFQTASELWIRHLAKDIVAFRDLSAADTEALLPGQMIFWSKRWFLPEAPGEFDGRLVRVQVRPRMSHHGGATRAAVPLMR